MDNKDFKILIVDDNIINLKILSKRISENNYQIETALTGQETFEKVDSFMPDLILLDIGLPDIDGISICKQIKSNPKLADIVIIFQTNYDKQNEIIEGFEAGGSDYVTKPYFPNELLARVKTHLELKQSRENLKKSEEKLKDFNEHLNNLVNIRTNDLNVAYEELKKAKEEIEQSNKIKSAILTNLSHEFKTPLFGIKGALDIIKDEIKDSSLIEFINIIDEASLQLLNSISQLLLFSQLESGNIEICCSKTDLSKMIKNCTNHFRQTSELIFNINIQEKISLINTDSNLLEILLTNIIENAVKFTPIGSITVNAFEKQLQFSNYKFLIQIIDTGIGIPKDMINYVFNEFIQVSEGHNRKFQGLGLGIKLSSLILKYLNGELKIESSPTEGTKVSIYLNDCK